MVMQAEAGLQVEEEKYADYLHSPCNYSQSTLIRIYVGMLFFVIFGSMPLAVYAFVVEHIYRGAGTESNDDPITIIKKLSDKALLRVFVTLFFYLWDGVDDLRRLFDCWDTRCSFWDR